MKIVGWTTVTVLDDKMKVFWVFSEFTTLTYKQDKGSSKIAWRDVYVRRKLRAGVANQMKQDSGVKEQNVNSFSNKRSWSTEETSWLINEVAGISLECYSNVQEAPFYNSATVIFSTENLSFDLFPCQFTAGHTIFCPEPIFRSICLSFNNRNQFYSRHSFFLLTDDGMTQDRRRMGRGDELN